ncbi:hypothetical protein MAM1_0007d00839 [Mucor ambiguus]|uniref:Spc7 kinetochore protein domain-containing protein n=1 Tax=Mucor ambiguus TaxID=91626 RepID=A0A0C9M0A5_9FUNG|nr:hypothetical protein MAM1_0007d00839 [Mucor ambiguus]
MSFTPPPMQSPSRARRLYESSFETHRWTVDNSESRYYQIHSPVRSILKEPSTPLRYKSPLFQHEQEQRRRHLAERRRVSFAPAANLRVYNEEDTPDISMRNVPSIIEEAEPAMLMADVFASPAHQAPSPFLQRLTGSPSDRRKRRPDLFGSPPGNTRSPKRRSGGRPPSILSRVQNDNEEEDGTSDLTQYLSAKVQKGPRNIFDEDDDDDDEDEKQVAQNTAEPVRGQRPSVVMEDVEEADDEEEEELEDPTVESMMITQTVIVPVPATSNAPTNVQNQAGDAEEEDDDEEEEDLSMAEANSQEADDDAMQITQELPILTTMQSPTVQSPLRKSPARDVVSVYSPHHTFYLHDKSPYQDRRLSQTLDLTKRFNAFDDQEDDLLQEEFPETYHSIPDIVSILNEEQRNSMLTDPIQSNNMSLSDFLLIAGIWFSPEIPAKALRRRSTYIADYGVATVSEQGAAALSTLPQLELYETSCQKLNQFIHECKDRIDQIDQDVSSANPQIFQEYNEGSVEARNAMGVKLTAMKKYAWKRAASEFYKIWSNTLAEFTEILQANRNKLLQDNEVAAQFEQDVSKKMSDISTYSDSLAQLHKEAERKEQAYDRIDHKALAQLEEEIAQQRASIEGFKRHYKELEDRESQLVEEAATLEKRKQEVLDAIQLADRLKANNQYVTDRDLAYAADKFQRCSKINKFRLPKAPDDTLELSINGDVDIVVDKKKLSSKSEDAVLIRLLERRNQELGPLSELVHGLQVIAKDNWDMDEIVQDISIYWNRVRMIQHELDAVQRRFWVEIKSLECVNDPEDAGFSCQICVSSYMGRTKFTVSFEVKSKDVVNYPKIDLSTFEVNLHYGSISQPTLEEMLRKGISVSGFNNLVDTLRNTLDQISIPT